MMAALEESFSQGGPAPNFPDSSVFQYLVNQPLCPMQLPAPFKEFALKVQEACDDSQLREALTTSEELDILEETGYTGVPQREATTSSNSLVQAICIKYLLQGSMPHIMLLQKGLSACNVLSSARENSTLMKPVFVPGFASLLRSSWMRLLYNSVLLNDAKRQKSMYTSIFVTSLWAHNIMV